MKESRHDRKVSQDKLEKLSKGKERPLSVNIKTPTSNFEQAYQNISKDDPYVVNCKLVEDEIVIDQTFALNYQMLTRKTSKHDESVD